MIRRLVASVLTLVLVVLGYAPGATGQPSRGALTATTTTNNAYDTSGRTSEAITDHASVDRSNLTQPARAAISSSTEPSADLPVFVAADDGATAGDLAGATCGGESFTPDTNVVMADGSTKSLDQVKVGDKVEATDPATGKTAPQTVTAVWVNHDTDLMDVTVEAGGKTSTIQATQHHLFWDVTRQAWVEADQLAAGDELRTDDGRLAAVASTRVVAGAADMWDLAVDNDHDFYVVTITANILVHNCPLLGEGGTQVTSKTLTPPGSPYRIDVENPAPGVRAGQLHLQTRGGAKYLYDFDQGEFVGLPGSLARQVANDPNVARAIAKARSYLGLP